MSSGAQHTIGIAAEATYGVAPVAPTIEAVLYNGGMTGGQDSGMYEDNTIVSDRNQRDVRQGAGRVTFDIPITLRYGAYDTILQALMMGTWSADVLKGGSTRRSFMVERAFGDLDAGAKKYHRYLGAEFTGLNLSLSNGAVVTGSVSGVAQSMTLDTAVIASSTYSAASTNKAFSSFVGSLDEGGSGITYVTALELRAEYAVSEDPVLFSKIMSRPAIGMRRVSGTLTAQFPTTALMEKFLDETESSLEFTLTDPDGNDLTVLVPRVKYSGGKVDVPNDLTLGISLPFIGLYDADTELTSLEFTRAAAP